MASSLGTRHDNQKNSYVEVDEGGVTEVAQRVKGFGMGSLMSGFEFDYIAVTYPTTTTESYAFKDGGVGGTTVATILVTYTDTTKADISSVART